MSQPSIGYRPALDGVRAIAVYLVVLYHAGVGAMSGGYIGVDLFFVLSGYLVTSILLAELETSGRLQLRRFYARRIRRLLPAAIAAIVGISLLWVLVAPITERLDLVRDARAALLYVANWNYIVEGQDYFATDVAESPFVHFWSLSIEEQFYFVFPVLLLALFRAREQAGRAGRLVLPVGLGLLLVASLLSQRWWADIDPARAYYGTETRFYQLLAGALLAVLAKRLLSPRSTRWFDHLLPLAGVVGIVALGTSLVDLSPSERGIAATLASVVLIAGIERGPTTLAGSALSRQLVVYLGRVSYGTYLWHWPLILVAGMLLEVDAAVMALIAVVSATAMAALSAEVLELPIRRSALLDRVPRQVVEVGLATSVAVAIAIPVVLEAEAKPTIVGYRAGPVRLDRVVQGGPEGSPEPTERAVPDPSHGAVPGPSSEPSLAPGPTPGPTATPAPTPDIDAVLASLGRVPDRIDWRAVKDDRKEGPECPASRTRQCVVVEGSGPTVLLVGDSTARTLVPMLTQLARENDFTFAANVRAACSWYIGSGRASKEDDERCAEARDSWYESAVAELQPDVLIVGQRSFDEPRWREGFIAADPEVNALPLDRRQVELARRTLDVLERLVPTVIVIEPVAAALEFDPADCLAGAKDIEQCVFLMDTKPEPIEAWLRRRAAEDPRLVSLDLDAVVCPELPACIPYRDGMVVYRDELHVTTWYWTHRAAQVWAALQATGRLG